MMCKHCGYQNTATAKYCAGCRKRLSDDGIRKWPLFSLMAVMILAAGILTGAFLFSEKENNLPKKTARGQQNVAEVAVAVESETTVKQEPLVLAYYEKTDSAPARYYYNEEGQLVQNVQEQWN